METAAVYRVEKSDHIWGIAKGLLPEGASSAEIWAAVRAIHDANPDVDAKSLLYYRQELILPDELCP